MKYVALILFVSVSARAAVGGVTVDFERDASLPLVHVAVAFRTGAASDPKGMGGLSKMTADMLRRGTQGKTKEKLDLALDQIGARVDVETRAEATIVRASVLSARLPQLLPLLTEILTRPAFADRELKRAKSEAISSLIEDRGNDSAMASRHFQRFLFRDHPYANLSSGTVEGIAAITRPRLVAHFRRVFVPEGMIVAGSGDADGGVIRAWGERLATELAAAGNRRADGADALPYPQARPPATRRLLVVDKAERTQTQILVGQLGVTMDDPRYFPLHLANHAFGGGTFTARLMTEIRVKRGWSYGAYSGFRHSRQPNLWRAYAFPAAKDSAPALKKLVEMIEEARAQGITPEEFSMAQRSLVNGAGFSYNTPRKRLENTVTERVLGLPPGFTRTYADRLGAVTRDQANEALREFLTPWNLTVVVLATASELKDALAAAAGVPPGNVEIRKFDDER